MGLDQWVAIRGEEEPIGYWRKHPDLHGWMDELWRRKRWKTLADSLGSAEAVKDFFRRQSEAIRKYYLGEATAEEAGIFNQVELPLTEQDILHCMEAIRRDALPETSGFFFGESDQTEEQRQEDLAIMEKCLGAVRQGKEVVYSSWW